MSIRDQGTQGGAHLHSPRIHFSFKIFISKDILNNPFTQSREFNHYYFEDIIRELILYHTGVNVIIDNVDDIAIYDIDYNSGDVTLSNISITEVPEKLRQMYDEEEFQTSMGPHYVLGMLLEYLKKYCLNDYDYFCYFVDCGGRFWVCVFAEEEGEGEEAVLLMKFQV